jgi:glycosyltransferase involved in cell wall biosynthesis
LDAAHQTNVTMTGFVENSRLPLYQAASEILVMPYGREVAASSGQDISEVINPMKMFEYMAAGRAIISADLPAIREVLDDSRAVFCPVGDAAAWRRAILALAEDQSQGRLALNTGAVLKYAWRVRPGLPSGHSAE